MLNIAFIIYFYQLFTNACPADMSYVDIGAADLETSNSNSVTTTTTQKPVDTTTKNAATGETSEKTYKRIGADW